MEGKQYLLVGLDSALTTIGQSQVTSGQRLESNPGHVGASVLSTTPFCPLTSYFTDVFTAL